MTSFPRPLAVLATLLLGTAATAMPLRCLIPGNCLDLDEATAALDRLSRTADIASKDTQETLVKVAEQISNGLNEAVGTRLQQALARAGQVAGSEARCTADFANNLLRADIREAAEFLRTGRVVPKPLDGPVVCSISAPVIDIPRDPRSIEISGYNLGFDRPALRVMARSLEGNVQDLTKFAGSSGNYMLSIPLAGEARQYLADAHMLEVVWSNGTSVSIPVIQPTVPGSCLARRPDGFCRLCKKFGSDMAVQKVTRENNPILNLDCRDMRPNHLMQVTASGSVQSNGWVGVALRTELDRCNNQHPRCHNEPSMLTVRNEAMASDAGVASAQVDLTMCNADNRVCEVASNFTLSIEDTEPVAPPTTPNPAAQPPTLEGHPRKEALGGSTATLALGALALGLGLWVVARRKKI